MKAESLCLIRHINSDYISIHQHKKIQKRGVVQVAPRSLSYRHRNWGTFSPFWVRDRYNPSRKTALWKRPRTGKHWLDGLKSFDSLGWPRVWWLLTCFRGRGSGSMSIVQSVRETNSNAAAAGRWLNESNSLEFGHNSLVTLWSQVCSKRESLL